MGGRPLKLGSYIAPARLIPHDRGCRQRVYRGRLGPGGLRALGGPASYSVPPIASRGRDPLSRNRPSPIPSKRRYVSSGSSPARAPHGVSSSKMPRMTPRPTNRTANALFLIHRAISPRLCSRPSSGLQPGAGIRPSGARRAPRRSRGRVRHPRAGASGLHPGRCGPVHNRRYSACSIPLVPRSALGAGVVGASGDRLALEMQSPRSSLREPATSLSPMSVAEHLLRT
jgi:hypothetical protein